MSEKFLSIVVLGHPQPRKSGDWLHRAYWPAEALGAYADVHLVQTTHSDWMALSMTADILVVLMLVDPLLLEVIAKRKQRGRATVYEISDDFKTFQKGNAQQDYYSQPQVQQLIESLAHDADAVQYSSPFLQDKYTQLNSVNQLVRNQLSAVALSSLSGVATDSSLVVGWSGSSGHLQDVTILARWLAAWPQHRRVVWRVMAAPALVKVFRKAGVAVKATPTGSMEDYLAFLAGLDVSLIWAGDDDFSRGRSDGKFLESASQGAAVLCRRNDAYKGSIEHNVTGLFFETKQELHQQLSRFVAEPAQARKMGLAAQRHVQQCRTHTHAALERLGFYASLTTMRTGTAPRFMNYFHESAETLLYDALVHHRNGDWAKSLTSAVKVMEQGYSNLLLWQLLQDTSRRLGRGEDAVLCGQRASEWLDAQLIISSE